MGQSNQVQTWQRTSATKSKNQPKCSRQDSEKKAKAKGKAKARPRCQQRMPQQDEDKRPPHMEGGKLWAFLGLHSRLIFAPSESFFHVCMEAVLNRARAQWNEPSWCSYFEKWYMSSKKVDEQVFRRGQDPHCGLVERCG